MGSDEDIEAGSRDNPRGRSGRQEGQAKPLCRRASHSTGWLGCWRQENLRMWIPTPFFKIDQLEEGDVGPGLEMTRTCIKLEQNKVPRVRGDW